jgi:PRC-barrel domain
VTGRCLGSDMLRPVDDPGMPISYEALKGGTPVYSSDGELVGHVEHVLSAPEEDVFDGIVIDEREGPDGHRFADADDVDSIHEHAVTLKFDAAACRALPVPSANPAVMTDDPAEGAPGLSDKLRRAWDRISGRY